MPKPAFAIEKLREAASLRRLDVLALLRANVTESEDEVIGSVLVDDATADWLCNGERERWSNEIIDRRNHALAWMVFATIPGAMVAGAAMALVWFSSMATVIVAMAALALFIPILGFAVRNAVGDATSFLSLRRRGHSEISSHILETFGGSVWLLGRKGLYFTCKPAPWKDEQRKVECVPYKAVGGLRIAHVDEAAILELISREGWYVTQLVFSDRSSAEDAARKISRYLGGPKPPGPRKRQRPPAKPGSKDPGFSLPATPL